MQVHSPDTQYKATLTREQFLFYEMRTTARLLSEGKSDEDAVEEIVTGNLFQYPTERMLRNIARVCVKRLRAMESDALVRMIGSSSVETAKQVCLYAMMCDSRLVWDFMITVIGEKYRLLDMSFHRMDVDVFMTQLQEQHDYAARWSDSTIKKIKQVLIRILVENEYLDSSKAERLNPVLLDPGLEAEIRNAGNLSVLPAFNRFD